ncbi:MAG: transporter substrate-binding domain-containing protein, partial [Synergistaceae bacterium]|nr:transporter substrate-binding domain-containing protein [Synergistaceae bacterium]
MILRKKWSRALYVIAALALVLAFSAQGVAAERLDRIMETKVLRVGTPGDYRPFSMLDKASGKYDGHDVDVAELLASDLGVSVEFVPTTWSKMMEDYQAGKFDVAMGGITRSLARMLKGDFLPPYAPNGKVALVRKADREKFTSLEAMDVPETTVVVNPGGTNEK